MTTPHRPPKDLENPPFSAEELAEIDRDFCANLVPVEECEPTDFTHMETSAQHFRRLDATRAAVRRLKDRHKSKRRGR